MIDKITAEKVDNILEVIRNRKELFFPQALEYFYTQAGEVLKGNAGWEKTKLSSGISSIDIFDFYKELINRDIVNGVYKKYTDPAGDLEIRYCLGAYNNLCIGEGFYTREDFCLTDGVTGGISSFLEWYSQAYKDSEVIIPCPNYYLAKLGCRRLGLKYKEVSAFSFDKFTEDAFATLHAIKESTTEQTKLIIITNPLNPTGKFLENEEVDRIIKFAQQKNIILLVDSIFLGLHVNSENQFATPDPFLCLGKQNNYLESMFFLNGLSKDRNIPGFRFGYIYSKHQEGIEKIVELQENKSFFSAASNIKTLAIYDTFFRYINIYSQVNKIEDIKKIKIAIKKILRNNNIFAKHLEYEEVVTQYFRFKDYFQVTEDMYSRNRARAVELLSERLSFIEEKNDHFNFFVNIKFEKHINLFDFCINLYIFTGIKVQPGPYFGFSQEFWEQQEGLWLRITYGYEMHHLEAGIPKLFSFIDEYKNSVNGSFVYTNFVFM